MPRDQIELQGHAAVDAYLANLARALPLAAEPTAFAAGEAIRSYMVRNMLSGQRLRRRTGRLATSFSTQRIVGGAVMGTNVVYAPPHEFGFQGVVTKTWRKTGRTFSARMNLRERRYLRDSIELSVADQLRAADEIFKRLVA